MLRVSRPARSVTGQYSITSDNSLIAFSYTAYAVLVMNHAVSIPIVGSGLIFFTSAVVSISSG